MKLGSIDLRRLRQRDIAIIAIVLSLLAGALWFMYLYRPTQERIATLEDDIQRLDLEIRRGEDARRNLPDLRLAVAQLEEDRRVFLSELPRESDVAGLLDQLRASAEQADVVVERISQGNASERIQDVRPIGFNMQTQGTYAQTMSFLAGLEGLQRFTKIGSVALSVDSDETEDPLLNASYDFTVYVYTGNDPGELE